MRLGAERAFDGAEAPWTGPVAPGVVDPCVAWPVAVWLEAGGLGVGEAFEGVVPELPEELADAEADGVGDGSVVVAGGPLDPAGRVVVCDGVKLCPNPDWRIGPPARMPTVTAAPNTASAAAASAMGLRYAGFRFGSEDPAGAVRAADFNAAAFNVVGFAAAPETVAASVRALIAARGLASDTRKVPGPSLLTIFFPPWRKACP